ncbi:hypothetical protein IFT43_10160 [Oxalobacteraceae sp. CFBP 13708]|nr:hypothetical protein [Oxalobacteraceae sp. CFBP 13708]
MTEPTYSENKIPSSRALYANASEALEALNRIYLFNEGLSEGRTDEDLHQIAEVIISDAASINPDWQNLLSISYKSHRFLSPCDAHLIQLVLNNILEGNWGALSESARKYALNEFTEFDSNFRSRFKEMCCHWPPLAKDTNLQALMAKKFTECESLYPELEQLGLVKGTPQTARIVLEHAWQHGLQEAIFKKPSLSSDMGIILRDSAGQTRWGQLHALLWLRLGNEDAFSAFERELDPHVCAVAALLNEFNLFRDEKSLYHLNSLSPQSRQSWRRELLVQVGEDVALREAAIEALFLYGAPSADREVLFAVAELQGGQSETVVAQLRHHSNRLVRRRAAALLDHMHSIPDVIECELLKNSGAEGEFRRSRINQKPTRTWIGDDRIEQLIEQTVNDVARNYCNEISPTRSSGEETHVAILFDRIGQALQRVSSRLEELARQHDEYEYLRIQLKHRIVGKAEEGGPGADGMASLSTDVCILFTGRDREILFAQRASLLQAKRITRDVNQNSDRYTIDRSQLEDLARQTSAGFLATLGPNYANVSVPIIPAKLMLEMIARGEPSTVLYPGRAAELGKSIGTWMLEDVIGLWSGDWNNNVIDVAQGGVYRRPYMLVELVVERLNINS